MVALSGLIFSSLALSSLTFVDCALVRIPRNYELSHSNSVHDSACGPCPEGSCRFVGCELGAASCSGGLCDFEDCSGPSCDGGGCSFVRTRDGPGSCAGGGCGYVDPKETLKEGYCKGGGCTLNGVAVPNTLRGGLTY